MKVLLFDNYDSFTYNLLHIVRELGADVEVRRNDKIELEEVDRFSHILLSPGPGIPEEAGLLLSLIDEYAEKKSILGVCLGMQAIGQYFGGRLENLPKVHHGVSSDIKIIHRDPLFEGLPRCFTAGRYHSWIVSRNMVPNCIEILAMSLAENYVMALRHKTYNVWGVQFHPESILTPQGKLIIENWLRI